MAFASPAPMSLADPAGTNAVGAAVAWLEATLLGPVATTIAVIAVSWIGLTMLTGHVNLRQGLTVILGCFILFGAPTIVAGLQSTVAAGGQSAAADPPPAAIALPPAGGYDPYAGAAVPGQ